MYIFLIIYFIFILYAIRSPIASMRRTIKARWEKVMDINNVDYDTETITSKESLRRLSADSQINDIYMRLLARRLYLHKVVLTAVIALCAIMGLLYFIFLAYTTA